MIRHILLPEVYNGYFVFQTKILGIHVTEYALYATMISASGWDRTITQHLYEPLEKQEDLTFAEQADAAIRNILQRIGSYDRLHIALPSREATYKELTLPFTDRNKIAMVAPFELEESLPFGLDEAVVTTLPIRYEQEQTHVLTITYRRSTLDAYLDAFAQHGMEPDITTCDAVAYYTAFYEMPSFLHDDAVVAYVDIDLYTSRVFVIDHGALRLVRTIGYGASNICKLSSMQYDDIIKDIKACNVDTETITSTELSRDLQFTIAGANKMLGPDKQTSHIYVTGIGGEISGISAALSATAPVQPERMPTNLPLRMPNVTTETNTHVPAIFMTSLATAMPTPQERIFNIRRDTVTPRERTIRTRQLAASAILTLTFFIGFFAYSMYAAYSLRKEVSQRKQQTREMIRKTFDIQLKDSNNLNQVIAQRLQRKVSQEESIWFSLSQQRRYSFLYYLQELGSHIDRKSLNLHLRKMVMQRDNKKGTETMKLEGNVAQYTAFEKALRESKLFTRVPPIEEEQFDISLTLQPASKD